jgi:hypothetical protein
MFLKLTDEKKRLNSDMSKERSVLVVKDGKPQDAAPAEQKLSSTRFWET